jgi:HAE1 family hydrophobic/amphiphilic exporter-1
MFDIFIKRPILSLVLNIFITLLGLLALFGLPVTQFPDIVPPSVVVTAKYTGANAEVCSKAVATPIERAINGVPGMTYISTVCTNAGITLVTVNFQVGTDPDMAAVNVQNRVTTVLDELPEEVIKAGVTTEKEVNSMLLYLNLFSEDKDSDEKFIYNFTDINILPELKRIDGVGFAEIMGSRDYAMRVWLKPDRLANYNVSTEEVIHAIREQNVEAAPGKVGESSDKKANFFQYIIKYTGKFNEEKQYEEIPIRSNPDGSILKLKDIAEIEFGSLDYHIISKTDGKPSASIMIKQRPGSNAREVIANVKAKMAELKSRATFPEAVDYNFNYDVSRFLDASIAGVVKTLIEAFILVFIVVYIFLQDFRSTLIPSLAVPVSLIGTFAFMQLFGFSLNLLTLFALVLAIGIVVDNAIVVVEAVHAKMTEEHMDSRTATFAAMKEISSALIAITLVMSAVFIPVAFMSGPVGIFYRQFSITLAIAIVISGINAVTLTPALCAIMLRNNHNTHFPKQNLLNKFFNGFNKKYDGLSNSYTGLIGRIAGRRTITLVALFAFFIGTWGINSILPTGFIPTEDQGVIYISVTTPVGSTVERTDNVLSNIYKEIKDLDGMESVSTLAGYSILTEASGASFGMGMVNLKPWKERDFSSADFIAQLKEKTKGINDAEIEFFEPPTVPGFGNASGFELRLIDRTGRGDLKELSEVSNHFISEVKQTDAVNNAFTSFDPSFPQYVVHFDYDAAAKKGVTVNNAMSTLQTYFGSFYTTNFIKYGLMYKVMVQADPSYRVNPEDVLNMYVKNTWNEMVPLSSIIRLEKTYGPEQITRFNMSNSVIINGDAAKGFSSGDAIQAVVDASKNPDKLKPGFLYEWTGMTREEILAGNQALYIFAISLLFVYLLLSAQYESFLLPLPVILSLPTGIAGSFFFLYITGLENNIFAQVSLVMLIGLLGKNAILIVEFANLKIKEGKSVLEATIEGATQRLRPILMTSFAFIAGLIPLAIASGAGAMGSRSIGTAAAGGMFFGTVFGVVLIPGLFFIFASIQYKRNKKKKVQEHKTS